MSSSSAVGVGKAWPGCRRRPGPDGGVPTGSGGRPGARCSSGRPADPRALARGSACRRHARPAGRADQTPSRLRDRRSTGLAAGPARARFRGRICGGDLFAVRSRMPRHGTGQSGDCYGTQRRGHGACSLRDAHISPRAGVDAAAGSANDHARRLPAARTQGPRRSAPVLRRPAGHLAHRGGRTLSPRSSSTGRHAAADSLQRRAEGRPCRRLDAPLRSGPGVRHVAWPRSQDGRHASISAVAGARACMGG